MTRISLSRTIFFGFLCAICSACNTLESSISYTDRWKYRNQENSLSLKYFTKHTEIRTTINSPWNEAMRSWSNNRVFFLRFFFFYLLHKGQMLVYSTWSLKYSLHKTWEDILNYLKATQCRKYTQHLKITFQFCITKLITRTVERHTKKKWESVFQSEKLYKDR